MDASHLSANSQSSRDRIPAKDKGFTMFTITLANLILGAGYIWIALPARVPLHYNYAGVADRIASKWWYLFFAALPFIIELSYCIYAEYTHRNARHNAPYIRGTITVIDVLFIIVAWSLSFAAAYGNNQISPYIVSTAVGVILGSMMLLISNIYGKLRPNKSFGIRTKATLASPEVWAQVHRKSGYIGVVGGFIVLIWTALEAILRFVQPQISLFIVLGIVIICQVAVPFALSAYYGRARK